MADMSVIAITPDNDATLIPLMRYLRAQTVRNRLEIIMVAPAKRQLAVDKASVDAFESVRIIESSGKFSETRARASGIRAASAPIVVLTEDHSFPEPGWAEALIRAHQQPWAVVGPVILNANPGSRVSWANLIIEYNEWLAPRPGGIVAHLPGHNSAYKRDVLLEYGSGLEKWLEAETLLHWDLQAKGHTLYIEPSAKLRHLNFSRLSASLVLRYVSGRQFAGRRGDGWLPLRKSFCTIAAPIIPCVRLYRILREMRRPGRKADLVPRLLPLLLLLLALDAVGEMAGYARGVGNAPQKITKIDFHRERFLNPQDRQRARVLGHI